MTRESEKVASVNRISVHSLTTNRRVGNKVMFVITLKEKKVLYLVYTKLKATTTLIPTLYIDSIAKLAGFLYR